MSKKEGPTVLFSKKPKNNPLESQSVENKRAGDTSQGIRLELTMTHRQQYLTTTQQQPYKKKKKRGGRSANQHLQRSDKPRIRIGDRQRITGRYRLRNHNPRFRSSSPALPKQPQVTQQPQGRERHIPTFPQRLMSSLRVASRHII